MIARTVALVCALALPAAAQIAPEIKEWTVPYEDSRPRDPYAVSPDQVWFVGQVGGYLARLNPQTGEFFQVDLGEGAGPHNLIVGADGRVWFAGNRNAYIGIYEPDTGSITKLPMPNDRAYDPHTLVFDADQSHIFFTVQGGNFLGRVTLADKSVDLVEVPTPQARPYGIKVAPDGTVWATLFGTYKLAELDPETLELTEHALPRDAAQPRRLAITSDGRIWYVDYDQGKLGVFDPQTKSFQEWDSPSGKDALPYGMTADDQDRLWYVETGPQPNRFVGFDPQTEQFLPAADIPSGGGTIRHMHLHSPTDTIWFGTDTNTVGRAAMPQ
ncbi:MAG: lyase [Rhodothalassiaceae bacterium]